MAGRKVLVPLGLLSLTTTQRDALTSPAAGFSIYNTTTGVVEAYNGSAWPAAPIAVGDLVLAESQVTNLVADLAARLTIAPRVTSITSNATWAPNADTTDIYTVTAQAVAVTTVSNPTGTPSDGQELVFRAKDNGTARAVGGWAGKYRTLGFALPTATKIGEWQYWRFRYNLGDDKWDLYAFDVFDTTLNLALLGLKANLASPTFTGTPVFPAAVVTLANQVNAAANSFRGNNTGSAAVPMDLTVAQAKTLLAIAQSDVTSLVSDLALKAPLASPTFTGSTVVRVDSAAFVIKDQTSTDGDIELTVDNVGVPVVIFAVKKDTADANAVLGFQSVNGTPELSMGPGGGTAYDISLKRTGTSAASFYGKLLAISDGIGYGVGTGGTVSQATSRTTGVTLSKLTGVITLFSTTLAADTDVSFVLTNTFIAATDNLFFNVIAGAAIKGGYHINAIPAAGSATITVHNLTPTITATEAPQIRFTVLKGVST